ncbi:MAG: ATP-binding cassette domain-containing protein [Acidimicrobiales bacterium]|nr:ATP-binding cassette domain-containing protein [Acidimicrobiales bacterium]
MERRRWLAPEVVQTSATDCGPASLTALLRGLGLPADTGEIRDRCHTDVDGTSIDALQDLAGDAGLDADQVVVPEDHLLRADADLLPAITVTVLPDGLTHFVLAWRTAGRFVQVMDPAVGRRWITRRRFLRMLYQHEMAVPAAAWREYADGDDHLRVLHGRLADLGLGEADIGARIDAARADEGWRGLARLDAAARATALLADGRHVTGPDRGATLAALLDRPSDDADLPRHLWSAAARPAPATDGSAGPEGPDEPTGPDQPTGIDEPIGPDEPTGTDHPTGIEEPTGPTGADGPTGTDEPEPEQVRLRGVVALTVKGVVPGAEGIAAGPAPERASDPSALDGHGSGSSAARRLLGFVRRGRPGTALAATVLAVLAGLVGVAEAVALRSVVAGADDAAGIGLGVIAVFVGGLVAITVVQHQVLRLGRHLDLGLRRAIAARLPRVADRYVTTRPAYDLADRAHSLHTIGQLPERLAAAVVGSTQALAAAVAVAVIEPAAVLPAVVLVAATAGVTAAGQPGLAERDLAARTVAGTVGQGLTDALEGLPALRAHGAAPALAFQRDTLLRSWAIAARARHRWAATVGAVARTAGLLAAAWVLAVLARGGVEAEDLLLAGFLAVLATQSLDVAGDSLRSLSGGVAAADRLIEPLTAPLEPDAGPAARDDGPALPDAGPALPDAGRDDAGPAGRDGNPPGPDSASTGGLPGVGGLAVELRGVAVEVAGVTVLAPTNLRIEPGTHVAVVGPSGAGKSSLLHVVLGLIEPGAGEVLVGDVPLDRARRAARRATAWLDPGITIWNATIGANVGYGQPDATPGTIEAAVDGSALGPVVAARPDGLEAPTGHGGAFLSGGEGQRVRVARALARDGVRLVIADEPFRGLDRSTRVELAARCRDRWRDATVLWATHDMDEVDGFDLVVVVEDGEIVEAGPPGSLGPGSRYRALVAADDDLRRDGWAGAGWRTVRVDGGRASTIPTGTDVR